MSERSARDRASWLLRRRAADPAYELPPIYRPAMWDETYLTERWEDRKARLAKERGQCA